MEDFFVVCTVLILVFFDTGKNILYYSSIPQ